MALSGSQSTLSGSQMARRWPYQALIIWLLEQALRVTYQVSDGPILGFQRRISEYQMALVVSLVMSGFQMALSEYLAVRWLYQALIGPIRSYMAGPIMLSESQRTLSGFLSTLGFRVGKASQIASLTP